MGKKKPVDKDEPCIFYYNLGAWPNYLGFTTSEEDFGKEMKRLGFEKDDVKFLGSERSNASTHFFTRRGKHLTIICMEPPSRAISKEQYAALLAHEAVHVIQEMQAELAGGKSLGHEAEAYLVQQIVQEGLQRAWSTGRTTRREP